jgi:hypothetical protein
VIRGSDFVGNTGGLAYLPYGQIIVEASLLMDQTAGGALGAPRFTHYGCVGVPWGNPGPPNAERVLSTDDPGFADRANGDFSLRDDAPAIDFCGPPYFGLPDQDFLGNPRSMLFNGAPAMPVDLGAFERQAMFRDGFED